MEQRELDRTKEKKPPTRALYSRHLSRDGLREPWIVDMPPAMKLSLSWPEALVVVVSSLFALFHHYESIPTDPILDSCAMTSGAQCTREKPQLTYTRAAALRNQDCKELAH